MEKKPGELGTGKKVVILPWSHWQLFPVPSYPISDYWIKLLDIIFNLIYYIKEIIEEKVVEGVWDVFKEIGKTDKEIEETKEYAKHVIQNCKKYNIDYKKKLTPEMLKFYETGEM